MSRAFFKPEPIAPDKSPIALSLKWSLRISATGWAMYGLFAFAFADLSIIPSWVQKTLVLIGSALIVIGAESNTIPTGVAALSKIGTGRFSAWDGAAFIASVVGSLCSVVITFSTRQVLFAETWWRTVSVTFGPLVLGGATVADFYGALAELALYKRDFELDWAQWWAEKTEWDTQHGAVELVVLPQEEEMVFDPSWEEATIDDARLLTANLNGRRATFTAQELLGMLHAKHKRPVSTHATKRWAREARKGTL